MPPTNAIVGRWADVDDCTQCPPLKDSYSCCYDALADGGGWKRKMYFCAFYTPQPLLVNLYTLTLS